MQIFRSLAIFVARRPIIVLVLSLILTLFLAAGIPNLKMRSLFEGDLPPDDPVLMANERCSFYFGKDESAYIALVNDTIYRPATLAKIAAITDELNSLDHVLEKETLSLATVRKVKWREWGLDVSKYLDPLPHTEDEVEKLRQDIRFDSDVYGRLVSSDETATVMAVRLSPGYDPAQLYQSFRAIVDKYSGPEKIYPFGTQIMSEEANIGIRHDARTLGPAALLLMAGGIFLFFRSFRLTLAPVLMIIMSIVWALGIMYYLGFRLSMLSPSIPAVLIALGSSYMIHVIYSCTEEGDTSDPTERVMEGVRKIGAPIALAAFTSMVGFATLVVFRVLSIREFGICVAFGVGFAAVLSLTLLPSVMVLQKGLFAGGRRKTFAFLDRVLRGLSSLGMRHKYLVAGAGVVLVVYSLSGIVKIKVGSAPEEIFPPNHRAREVVSLFIDKFHGPYTFNVMFTAGEQDGLKSPEILERIDKFQKFAEEIPKVKHASSIVNIIKRMNRVVNEDDPDFYRVPDSRELVAQLILLHSLAQDPVQFEKMLDYDFQRCKVTITTSIIDTAEIEELYRHLTDYCARNLDGVTADFGGRGLVWMAQNHYIIVGKIITIIANTFLIWTICAVAFRSVRLGFISILPLSLATMATFGLMGHSGIRLDIATAVITGISVGVGVDFAIHLIARLRRQSLQTDRIEEAMETSMIEAGRAIIFDATSNTLGFIVFIFSGFMPVRTLGVLICFTMVSCVVLTLIVIPAFIALVPVPFRHSGKKTVFLRGGQLDDEAALCESEKTE